MQAKKRVTPSFIEGVDAGLTAYLTIVRNAWHGYVAGWRHIRYGFGVLVAVVIIIVGIVGIAFLIDTLAQTF